MNHSNQQFGSRRQGRVKVLLIPWLLWAGPAGGQDIVATLDGKILGEEFGLATGSLGDVDGDGTPDLLIGAPMGTLETSNPGTVRVYSGGDLALRFEFVGDTMFDQFGYSVAGAGDVDLDGVPDLIVGAPYGSLGGPGAGRARVLSGKDGSALFHLISSDAFGFFGHSVAGIGDVNHDGAADLAIGIPGKSRVQVISGKSGTTLSWILGAAGTSFGHVVAGGGDVDQDGVDDVLVSAPEEGATYSAGAVRVYSGATFSLLRTILPVWSGGIGGVAAFVGDVDADGADDLVVGGWSGIPGLADGGGTLAYVISGATGGAIYTYQGYSGPGGVDTIGTSVNAAGDIDGDGRPDFALGARLFYAQPVAGGLVRCFSGKDGSLLMSTLSTPLPDNHTFANFGDAISLAGDVNQDGVPDLLVGAPRMGNHAVNPTGLAFVISTVKIKIPIMLGDTLIGNTTLEQPVDALGFDALAGTQVTLKLDNPGEGLAPVVSIKDATHQLLFQWQLPANAQQTKQSFVLPATGSYSVWIEGAAGTTGGYKLKTNRKLPKGVTGGKLTLSGSPGYSFPFAALPGAMVDINLDPKGSAFPFDYQLIGPTGQSVDLTGHVVIKPSGTVKIVGLSLAKLGTYHLHVTGFQNSQQKMKLKVKVEQPKGSATLMTPTAG